MVKRKPTNLHTGNRCRLKKAIPIELTEFCLLVIYNKPEVVQYIYIAGQRFLFKTSCFSFSKHSFVLINSEDPDEMPHYIWVFTVCQSTQLEVNGIHRVK